MGQAVTEEKELDCASTLVAEHGRRAAQVLVDEIVRAVRQGDDSRVQLLDEQLRLAERLIERAELLRVANG